jgi:dihydroneopterin aldolase/2-amino-4-hydroxy-6-hydroxymethyldihydropteridine diphosphokinase/dihydropteroate synthase
LTLEALASDAASKVLQYIGSRRVDRKTAFITLRAAKPAALVFARSAEIEVRRSFEGEGLADTPSAHDMPGGGSVPGGAKVVAIALGSNLGDRFYNIELSLRLLEAPKELLSPAYLEDSDQDVFATIVDTSFLYETAPMYVTDQPAFINCACLVRLSYLSVSIRLIFR